MKYLLLSFLTLNSFAFEVKLQKEHRELYIPCATSFVVPYLLGSSDALALSGGICGALGVRYYLDQMDKPKSTQKTSDLDRMKELEAKLIANHKKMIEEYEHYKEVIKDIISSELIKNEEKLETKIQDIVDSKFVEGLIRRKLQGMDLKRGLTREEKMRLKMEIMQEVISNFR